MPMLWRPVETAAPPEAFAAAAEAAGFRLLGAVALDDPEVAPEHVWAHRSGALLSRGDQRGVIEVNLATARADGTILRTISLPAASRAMLPDDPGVPEAGLLDRVVLDADLPALIVAHTTHLAEIPCEGDVWPIDDLQKVQRLLWRTSGVVEARLFDAALRSAARWLLAGGMAGLLVGAFLLFLVGGWTGICLFTALAAPAGLAVAISGRLRGGAPIPARVAPNAWERPGASAAS